MPSQRPRDAADIHCHVGKPRMKACTAMIRPGSAHASQIYNSHVYIIPYFIQAIFCSQDRRNAKTIRSSALHSGNNILGAILEDGSMKGPPLIQRASKYDSKREKAVSSSAQWRRQLCIHLRMYATAASEGSLYAHSASRQAPGTTRPRESSRSNRSSTLNRLHSRWSPVNATRSGVPEHTTIRAGFNAFTPAPLGGKRFFRAPRAAPMPPSASRTRRRPGSATRGCAWRAEAVRGRAAGPQQGA